MRLALIMVYRASGLSELNAFGQALVASVTLAFIFLLNGFGLFRYVTFESLKTSVPTGLLCVAFLVWLREGYGREDI